MRLHRLYTSIIPCYQLLLESMNNYSYNNAIFTIIIAIRIFGRINIEVLVLKSKQRLNNNNIQTQTLLHIDRFFIRTYVHVKMSNIT